MICILCPQRDSCGEWMRSFAHSMLLMRPRGGANCSTSRLDSVSTDTLVEVECLNFIFPEESATTTLALQLFVHMGTYHF